MFACCFLNVRLRSFSFRKSRVERKKKTEDTQKGKSEGTKENYCVNHLNRRIINACALDLDVVVGSRNTTTHGRVVFVEVALVLFNNWFA
jgi:hypothetical protein